VAQTAAFVVQMAGPVAGMAGGVAALFRPEAGPCFLKGRFFLREAGTKGRSLWHVAFFAASVGVYMRVIADLASSRWLGPDPSWDFAPREVRPGCLILCSAI